MRQILQILCSGCLALVLVGGEALAASRQIFVLVEKPILERESPPSNEQIDQATELGLSLQKRILAINIDGHKLINGRESIDSNDGKLSGADSIVQVLMWIGSRGYRIKARMFDKDSKTWLEIAERIFGQQSLVSLETAIFNEIAPPMVVRALELAQPLSKSVLLADCLVAAIDADLPSSTAGRIFSQSYGNRLRTATTLVGAYSVVPLVTTVQTQFYKWWCTEVPFPRRGMQRDDTFTISGSIENVDARAGQSQLLLSLQIKKADRSVISEPVPLNLSDPSSTTTKITTAIQELANGL